MKVVCSILAVALICSWIMWGVSGSKKSETIVTLQNSLKTEESKTCNKLYFLITEYHFDTATILVYESGKTWPIDTLYFDYNELDQSIYPIYFDYNELDQSIYPIGSQFFLKEFNKQ